MKNYKNLLIYSLVFITISILNMREKASSHTIQVFAMKYHSHLKMTPITIFIAKVKLQISL